MNKKAQRSPSPKAKESKPKASHKNQRYKLGKEIGAGTFGRVFESTDLQTGERVAIKQAYQDTRYKNRELDIVKQLRHENIVEVKDYYFIDKNQKKYLYMVMDVYETNMQLLFKKYRKERAHIDRMDIKVMAFQLFKGLYYLQQMNVCHRDIKPSNLLVNQSTLQVRVCDFGSAKLFKKVQSNVCYICSRYYRPPELIFKYDMHGLEIDMWSAGCILVEFLTKEPLFPGDSSIEQLIEIIKVIGTPPPEYIQAYTEHFDSELNLPNIESTGWDRLLNIYKPEPLMVDLISKILVFDIKKRLTPFEVLKHPYFHDLTQPKYAGRVQKLPQLFSFTSSLRADNQKQIIHLSQLYQQEEDLVPMVSIEKQRSWQPKEETGDSTPMYAGEGNPEMQHPMHPMKNKSEVMQTSDTLPGGSQELVEERG